MHIKRLLSGTLAALMVVTSFNVPTNYVYAEELEPETVIEENVEGDDNESEEEEEVVEEVLDNASEITEAAPEDEAGDEGEEVEYDESSLNQSAVTVTLAPNNGEWELGSTTTATTNEEGKLSAAPASTGLSRAGYTFAGWSTTANGAVISEWASVTFTDESKTLFAIWAENQVTFTFDKNDDDADGAMASSTILYTADSKTFPECAFTAPTGKEFDKWQVGNDTTAQYSAGADMPATWWTGEGASDSATKTLKAVWKDIEYTTTVKFDPNTTDVVRGLMSDQTITGTENLNECTMVRSGYDFAGWNTQSNGNGTNYADKGEFAATSTASVTLYAKWVTETTSLSVAFDGNEATSGSMTPQTFQKGKYSKIKDSTFVKNGKTQDGWAESSDGDKKYNLGQSVKFTAATTLYAHWVDGKTVGDGLIIDGIPENDIVQFTGKNLETDLATALKVYKDSVAEGNEVTITSPIAFTKYTGTPTTLAEAQKKDNYTNDSKWETAIDHVNGIGIYRAKIVIPAAPEVKGETTYVVFEVKNTTITGDIINLAGAIASGDNKGKWLLTYSTSDDEAKKGIEVVKVTPTVTLKLDGLTDGDDYSVKYENNDKVGTGKVIVTFENTSYTRNYGIYADETAPTEAQKVKVEKTFDIVACDHSADQSWTVASANKATATAAGKETAFCATCHKAIEKAIPKIDASKTTIIGSRREADFEAGAAKRPHIDGIFDSTGKEITGLTEVTGAPGANEYKLSYAINSDGKGVITVTLGTLDNYKGSFELTPIELSDCDAHDYEEVITPGTTEDEGKVEVKCKNCGDIKSTKYIKKLDASSVSFNVKNDAAASGDGNDFSTYATNGIPFIGKAIEINSIEVKTLATAPTGGAEISANTTTYKNVGNTANTYKSVEDDKETGYFTVSFKDKDGKETNKGVGTCSVTITFTDKVPEYAGSSITKTFKIAESDEVAVAPKIKNQKTIYRYGDEIVLESATAGAKVYYAIAESNTEKIVDGTPAKLQSNALTYKNAIKLDSSMYSVAGALLDLDGDGIPETKSETITLLVAAQKGSGTPVADKYTLTVVDERDDYGDVAKDGSDRELLDATEIPDGIWISDKTLGTIEDKSVYSETGNTTYTGLAKELPKNYKSGGVTVDVTKNYRVFFHNKKLDYGKDYSVTYKNNVNAWTKAGASAGIYDAAKAPTITITGKGEYAGSFSQVFEIQPKNISTFPLSAITPNENTATTLATPATIVPDVSLQENGKVQTPKFVAKYNYWAWDTNYNSQSYKTLTLGSKDISVDYTDIEAVANTTAKPLYEVTLTGTGNYTGTVSRYVKVVPAGLFIDKATVSFDTTGVTFDGNNQLGNVKATVKIGTIELVQGKDFELECEYQGLPKRNAKTDSGYSTGYGKYNQLFTAGKYIITVKAKAGSNYSGSVSKTVTITNKGQANIKNVDVTIPSEVPELSWVDGIGYVAEFANADVLVKDGGNILTLGQDYLLLYKNNLKAGKAKITVVGIGKYTGTKDVSYTIDATKLTDANIKYVANAETYVYDGTAHYTDIDGTLGGLFSVVVTENNQPKTLTQYVDYMVTDVKDSVNAGKKTIKVTGINNYKGSVNVKYEITKFDISKLTGSTANSISLEIEKGDPAITPRYTGAAVQPTLGGPVATAALAGMSATEQSKWYKDNFSFSYKNGYKAGSTVTVKVTGKKNFSGSVTGTYTVDQANIANVADVTITDVQSGKRFVAPKITVKDTNTKKTLSKGAKNDYTVDFLYNASSETHKRYDKVAEKEAITAGTEFIARINGVGGYKNYKDVVFRVVDKAQDLSKATVKINGTYIFKDQPIMLDKDDIVVSIGGVAVPSDNFEIVGYKDNAKVGTAKVTIHGVIAGDKKYGGYKEASFKIEKLSMNYILQFKAAKKATDGKDLTISGKINSIKQKDNAAFVVPKNGFTASVGTGKSKVAYTLSYFADESGVKYQPGNTYVADIDPSGMATLTAYFEPAKDGATLTFAAGTGADGKAPNDIKTKRGVAVKLPGKGGLKKANYDFVGWTSDGGTTVLKAGAMVCNLEGSAAKFTAVWVESPYKITYNYDKGNAPATIQTTYTKADAGKAITTTAPSRAGYAFAGWTDGTKDQKPNKDYKIPADKVGKTITLKANWTANTFNLAFDANGAAGATTPATMTGKKVGESIKLPDALTSTDKQLVKFEGWAKDKNAAKPDYKAKANVKDLLAAEGATLTLYAVWTPAQYTVTWDLNGGTTTKTGVKVYTAKNAASITKADGFFPDDPTRAKRTFGGWKIDGKGDVVTSLASLATDPKNVTLVADWGDKDNTTEKTITYNTGDAGIVMEAKKVVVPDTVKLDTLVASNAKTMTSDKYVFSGWDADDDGDVDYGNGAEIKMTDTDVSLTAVWKEKSYGITYNTNGGTFDETPVIDRTFYYGENKTLATTIKYAGHKFDGWYASTDTEFKTKIDKVPADAAAPVSYTAKWTGYKMTIKYSKDNATQTSTWNDKVTKIDDQVYQIDPATGITNPTSLADDEFTLKGYTFKGWAKSTAQTTVVTLDDLVKELTAGDDEDVTVSLVPVWEANTYTVVLNYDGGEISDSTKTQPTEFKTLTTVAGKTALTAPKKEHYSGTANWVIVDSATADLPSSKVTVTELGSVAVNNLPAEGSTLYLRADYGTIDNSVEITFEGGTGASGTMAKQTVFKGDKITKNAFTKTGYVFNNWSVSSGGTKDDQAVYSTGAIAATGKVTLTAQWTLLTTTIHYNANGGTGTTADTVYNATDSAAPEFRANGFSKTHYTFKEWNTKRNGTGTSYKPTDKATAFIPTSYVKEVTLYAIWTEDAHATITYNANGGTLGADTENPVKYYDAASVTNPTNDPTREGYTFAGWKEGSENARTTITADDVKDSKSYTFTASWTATNP